VSDPNPEKLTLKVKAKSGKVSGSLLFEGRKQKFSGLFQLEQNVGAGFFFSDTESLPFEVGED
jgi:hypothetical protein